MNAIKTDTSTGLVRTLYGREPGEESTPGAAPRSGFGFALALVVLALLFGAIGACAGCSNTNERREHLLRAGRILVRHWGEPDWTGRRDQWAAAVDLELPEPAAPVESGR